MAYLQFPSPTQLRNISDPSNDSDAATKGYVDAAVGSGGGNISVNNITANVGNISNVTANVITTTVVNTGDMTSTGNTTFSGNVTLSGPTTFSGNVTLAGSTVDLGAVANLVITGGSAGYILQTDGSGNLTWVNPSSTVPALDGVVDEFTGDGINTDFTLSVAPYSKNVTFAVVHGLMQPKSSYSVTGNTLSFSQAPPNGALVEITTMKLA